MVELVTMRGVFQRVALGRKDRCASPAGDLTPDGRQHVSFGHAPAERHSIEDGVSNKPIPELVGRDKLRKHGSSDQIKVY